MNKTPVSILQEMMVKKGTVPNYELIHDGGGSHINTFTYQVTCDGLCTTGTGRCKKDAKHEAAKAMLTAIAAHHSYPQLPASPADSPIKLSHGNTTTASPRSGKRPFFNAIGALQDLCFENSLQDPEYYQISDVGPPHARVFTMQCVVSTFKEEGVAKTKKEAKHEAAIKMIERIKEIIRKGLDEFPNMSGKGKSKEIIAHEIAIGRYPQLSKLPTNKRINLGLKLSSSHLNIRNSYDETARKDITQRLFSLAHDDDNSNESEKCAGKMIEDFKNFLKASTLEMECRRLNSVDQNGHVIAAQINTEPEIMEIGCGQTHFDAEIQAVRNLINAMILFLK